jgi:hypothetical protein
VKKLIVALTAAALVMSAVSCAGKPQAPKAKGPAYQVLDHKTMAIGGDIPAWVTTYIEGGAQAVEALDAYKEKYVFVGEDSGTNLPALRLWVQNFNIAQDLSQMVSLRVKTKFAGAAAGSPDDEFGRYFENVVKNTSEASFSGARKETDFWIQKRFFKEDGKTVDREAYDVYVLVSIDKESLKNQIQAVLDGTAADTPPSKEQQTAIDRVKESFYEGF